MRGRQALVDVPGQQQALRRGRVHERLHGGPDDGAHVDRRRAQLELGGLDLRQVEDVADDLQQRPRGAVGGRDHLALRGAQLAARKYLEHAGDPDHRRAQLVAHRGEERRLRAVGVLGGLARHDGVLLGTFARRDVGFDRGGHLVERARDALEVGHRVDVDALGVVAAGHPPRGRREPGERAQHDAGEDDERGDADEDDRQQVGDLDRGQPAVVVARALDVARRAFVDERDEAVDRLHDLALGAKVGLVDEPPVVGAHVGEVARVDAAGDAPGDARHDVALELGQAVGRVERRLQRTKLGRREVRGAHLRDERLGRVVAHGAATAGEHAVPERAVVVARAAGGAIADREDLVVILAVARLAAGDVQADHVRQVVGALTHAVGDEKRGRAAILRARLLVDAAHLQRGDEDEPAHEQREDPEQDREQAAQRESAPCGHRADCRRRARWTGHQPSTRHRSSLRRT